MTLHRNARTCPNSRLLIADRVLERGLVAGGGGRGRRRQRADRAKWVRRFREQGDAGLTDRSLGAEADPACTPPERERGDPGAAGAAAHRPRRSRRRSGWRLRRSRGAQAQRPGTPAAAWSRSARASLRAPAAGRAGARRRQEARPDRAARPPRDRRAPRRAATARASSRAGNTCTSASTTPPGSPTSRCSMTSAPTPHRASCGARSPSSPPRHPGRASDDRQRQRLPLTRPRARLPRLGVRHLRTAPYRPRTNGKAERFIQHAINGWAYGAVYGSSAERTRAPTPLADLLQLPPAAPSARRTHPRPPASPNYTTRLGLTPSRRAVSLPLNQPGAGLVPVAPPGSSDVSG